MKRSKKNTKGLSLMVLVITVLVTIVLAGAVILITTNNNPIDKANESIFKSDLKNFVAELDVNSANDMINGKDTSEINASGNDMLRYIPSLEVEPDYINILVVIDGKLYLLPEGLPEKNRDEMIEWARRVGVKVYERSEKPVITDVILEADISSIKVTVSVTDSISGINKYTYKISEDNVTFRDEIDTTNSHILSGLKTNTKYYIKVQVTDKAGNMVESDVRQATTGNLEVDEGDITFTVTPNLGNGIFTNKDVRVTVNYPNVSGLVGQYGTPNIINPSKIDWVNYAGDIIIGKNTVIYARMVDGSGNDNGQTHPSIQITQIDKVAPQRFTPNVTEVNTNSLKITGSTTDAVATTDNASSGIKGYQYRVDGGSWTTETTATEYTFTGLSNKSSHTLSMRAIDKAGNVGIEESVTKNIGEIPGGENNITFTLNPNLGEGLYTNGNVQVTINYPTVAGTTKKYSYDGTTWSNYTSTLVLSENKTVYAKLVDSIGNEGTTASKTINKIDKVVPTISNVTASNINSSGMTVTVSANDNLSGIKGYKLSKDNGVTYTAEQSSNIFNLTGLTASTGYNIKVQVIDKVNNIATSGTYTFTTTEPPLPCDKPYTPTGFTHTEGTWNNGYVIRDNSNGNEFVWIPVKYMSDFKLTDFGRGTGMGTEIIPTAIRNSVIKYGGYYIARYEAGTTIINENLRNVRGTPTSKKGQMVWNNIDWNNSLANAKAMYNNSEIASDLIYGTMWDTACNWLENSGYNIYDSTSWGNHGSNTTDTGSQKLQNTGYNENWKANSIYDLARQC